MLVVVRELMIHKLHAGSAQLTHNPWLTLYRLTTLPTGGTAMTKTSVDSADTSNSSVVIRGKASADVTTEEFDGYLLSLLKS